MQIEQGIEFLREPYLSNFKYGKIKRIYNNGDFVVKGYGLDQETYVSKATLDYDYKFIKCSSDLRLGDRIKLIDDDKIYMVDKIYLTYNIKLIDNLNRVKRLSKSTIEGIHWVFINKESV